MRSNLGNFYCKSGTQYYNLKTFLVISLSLLIRFGTVNSVQPTQSSKVPHPQSIGKDRADEGDISGGSGPSSGGKYSNSKSYASSPSSSYYAYGPTPYNGYYLPASAAEPYYDGYYERPARQFSARSSTYPIVPAASNQVGFADTEYAATGHGHGHGHSGGGGGYGGHGGGWSGHGGGHHTTYYESVSKVDTSSLGLLGLLGLLSLLSNVLLLITTTAAAAPAPAPAPAGRNRLKREVDNSLQEFNGSSEEDKIERVCQMILPSLNVVGHAQNGRVPVNCTHQEVCKSNKILVNEFGVHGRTVGSMLSTAIQRMLRDVDQSSNSDKYLHKASLDGRNGLNCETIYPTCEALERAWEVLPQLISPEHVTAIVHGKNPKLIAKEISRGAISIHELI